MSEFEKLLTALLNGESADITPKSRMEKYLKNCVDKCGCDDLPTPRTRGEVLLYQLAEQMASGGGIPDGYIKPEGTKQITENGEHDVTTYAKVNVAVSGGGDEFPADKYFEGGYAEVVLPTATKLKDYAFYKDMTIRNIEMPKVTMIGADAFNNCNNLALTSLPSGLTDIGGYAFNSCSNLALTELPSGVKTIPLYSFFGCNKLSLTSLPSGVTYIGSNAFANCTNLSLTSLPSGVTNVEMQSFKNCTGLTSITFKGKPTYIASNAFTGCTNLTTINVPWAEGEVANAPWGATNATINYNYTGE